jgi:hypothetical protein
MAHIDVGTNSYLLVTGDACAGGDCWHREKRGLYGQVYFANEGMPHTGRVVAELFIRAIGDAVRTGALPPEEP